ncbi:MAG: alkaline phosphatase family protein [Chitinophagales bacterium]
MRVPARPPVGVAFKSRLVWFLFCLALPWLAASVAAQAAQAYPTGATMPAGATTMPAGTPTTPDTAPRRPARPRYVVYLNWDGFGYQEYLLANQPPYAGTPNLNALLADGALFTSTSTGVPSITQPMQTSLVTGAWPAVTGNYYRGYDKQNNLLIQTGRENAAQTLAEVFAAAGWPTASVQQFTLLDRGTRPGDPLHLYLEPHGPFSNRAAAALDLINLRPVRSGDETVTMLERPRFLAIYADDLDALGHNLEPFHGVPIAKDEAGRLARVLKELDGEYQQPYGLEGMDQVLGKLIQGFKDLGLYDETLFVLASDHGMTGYSGMSSLPDLLAVLGSLGYRAQLLRPGEQASPDTQIVLWTVGLQMHFAFRWDITPEEYNRIVAALAARDWYGGHYSRAELAALGAHPFTGDLLVWPRPPYNFKTEVLHAYEARGQHDTPDWTSRNNFLALAGPGVKRGAVIVTPVDVIDLAPTVTYLAGLPAPAQSQGRVLFEALEGGNDADGLTQDLGGR